MDQFILTDDALLTRSLIGFALAVAIAVGARRLHALTASGAVAAAAVGACAVAAGWGWGALLLAFFASATLLSRLRRDEKSARTASVVEKDDERDAVQVLANGGIFAAMAVMFKLRWLLAWGEMDPAPAITAAFMALGAGAISAACADTWSTEIGTLSPAAPRSITTGRPVPPGTSGGVTGYGLLGMVAGAAFMGAVARLAGSSPAMAVAAAGGGITGALADSFLGALAQERRRCPRCDALTERLVHDCGTATEHAGGFAWLDNDAVNALATGVGALAAFIVWRVLV